MAGHVKMVPLLMADLLSGITELTCKYILFSAGTEQSHDAHSLP